MQKIMKRGFTLIEVLVALVMFAVVSGSIYTILITNQRTYQQQAARVNLNSNVRTAASFLPGELRELNASDSLQSDIVAMDASFIRYKAMRNLYFLCQAPIGVDDIVLWQDPWFGLRSLDSGLDSVMIFADGSESSRLDDRWVHAGAFQVSTGTECPGAAPSIRVKLKRVSTPGLAGVRNGAPVRGYEVMELSLYQDTYGDYWLGTSRYLKGASVWSAIDPLVGPLSSSGVQLTYFDTLGTVTTDPRSVARIGVTVTGESDPVRSSSGSVEPVTVELVTSIALRNNIRY